MSTIKKSANIVKKIVNSALSGPIENVPRIFYCHVPKCAGTSVADAIRRKFYDNFKTGSFHINLEASRQSGNLYSIDRMTIREIVLSYKLSIDKYYFGFGHCYCRPKIVKCFSGDWNFVTILRNPVDRWISEFVYNTYKDHMWAKNTLTIEKYIESRRAKITANSFLRYFSSMEGNFDGNEDSFVNEAVENLKTFKVVGTIENIGRWCESFKKQFGTYIQIPKRNASPKSDVVKRIHSDRTLMKKIKKLCESDISVYQRILKET